MVCEVNCKLELFSGLTLLFLEYALVLLSVINCHSYQSIDFEMNEMLTTTQAINITNKLKPNIPIGLILD